MEPTTAFLLSSWYSGATFLTLLLDWHPEIVSNGEGFPFRPQEQNLTCTCGASLKQCKFYRYAAAHMLTDAGFDASLFAREPCLSWPKWLRVAALTPRLAGKVRTAALHFIPGGAGEVQRFVAAHRLFIERALAFSNARVYVDATKSLPRAELLLRQLNGKKIVWLLVRDCRGYVNRRMKITQWPRERLKHASREWVDYIRYAKKVALQTTGQLPRMITYESLCQDTRRVLASLFDDVGLANPPNLTALPHEPHVIGNHMRMTFDGNVRFSERWREEMTQADQEIVLSVAGRLMEELGYSL